MRRVVLLMLFFITSLSFGQRRYFADRFFEEFAYKESAELYERIYKKGDSSIHVLSRLGDSYYNVSNYLEAEVWYEKLVLNYDRTQVPPEYFFKYAQSLKSNGKIASSDSWMLNFSEVKEGDSRGQALGKNKNYFVNYSKASTSYLQINNLASNTKYSDFGGFIYEGKLYYTSAKPQDQSSKSMEVYNWNNQPFLNIYSVEEKAIREVNAGSSEVPSSEMFEAFNSKYHESNLIFSKDGNTLYFTKYNFDGKRLKKDKKRITHLKIYKAEKINGVWGNIKELPFNNDDYSTGHPALSPDEKTLYFVSDRPNGYGLTDVYKVSVDNHNNFGEPENLGATINTEGKELFPYVDKDNTLYFSSNGHLGLGALDIFETKLEGEEYAQPVNLGAPINSSLDDFGFIINNQKTWGYFSSNRKEGGKGDDDIYSFLFTDKNGTPEELAQTKPPCKQITGVVKSKIYDNLLADVKVYLYDKNGKVIGQTTSGIDGTYSFDIYNCGEDTYSVKGEKLDYKNNVESLEKSAIVGGKSSTRVDLSLSPLIIGNQLVINQIYFDFNKANIREDAKYELESIVKVMRTHPEMVIKIESHSDTRGLNSYNRALSDRRAKSTRDYIYSRGIEKHRIQSAIGYGEDQPLNNCNSPKTYKCSEQDHQENRRSYFYIVDGTFSKAVKEGSQTEGIQNKEEFDYHTVFKGDTLYNISKRYGLEVVALKSLNGLTKNTIFIGQKLRVR